MNDLINKTVGNATGTSGTGSNTGTDSNKQFEDVFTKALVQIYNSQRIFNERVGTNHLNEELDKILSK